MEFGLQFFPDIGPKVKPADRYFAECLHLTSLADELRYGHIRTVEHYFEDYGGYSPNPIIFLTAAAIQQPAQARGRDRHARRDFRRAARGRIRARLPAA
jgi:hypothetical protein